MLTILAPTDLGAEILFWSPHRIIASNYHREGPGIRYVWEADAITRFSTLRAYLSQRKVDALLVCPVAQAPTQSALQALQQETRTPPWLARVTLDITHPQPSDPAFFLLTPSAR